VPASLRQELETALDAWCEFEGSADHCTRRGEHSYVGEPRQAVERLLRGASEVGVSAPVARRLRAVRPALLELLRVTPLEDLDGLALLDQVFGLARLQLVENRVTLAPDAEEELRDVLERTVKAAVDGDVVVPDFVERVVRAVAGWAKRRGVSSRPLAQYRRELEAGGFDGVVWYRGVDEQRGLVNRLVRDVVDRLRVRWARAPRSVQAYSAKKRFEVGDRLTHPTFGLGEVVRRGDGKVDVQFPSGKRTLAAG
jgi:hypothetical protein